MYEFANWKSKDKFMFKINTFFTKICDIFDVIDFGLKKETQQIQEITKGRKEGLRRDDPEQFTNSKTTKNSIEFYWFTILNNPPSVL